MPGNETVAPLETQGPCRTLTQGHVGTVLRSFQDAPDKSHVHEQMGLGFRV